MYVYGGTLTVMQSLQRAGCWLALLLCCSCAVASGPAADAKLIDWGWGTPRLQQMPAYIDAAQATPFDGAVVDVETDLDPRGLSWTVFGNQSLDRDHLATLADEYGDLEWGRYTHNFLRLTVHPADVGWFDDWQTINDNAEAWATLAHELGFVGVMLDVEQYSDADIFRYPAQTEADTLSFEEYAVQAVARGRAYMDALEAGHPNITVIYTFALTVDQPDSDWETHTYGLLVPFVEGMVSAADDNTTLVDGHEHSYIYNTEEQFVQAASTITGMEPRYTDFDAPPQVGFGLWVDVNCGDGGLPPEGCGFSPSGFRQAVDDAKAQSDGYVWIYSQKINWYTRAGIPSAWWDALGTD